MGGKRHSQLATHAARRRRGRDVRRHGEGAEAAVAVRDGFCEGDALGAGADGVGSVFDVGACDDGRGGGEESGADAEGGVGAYGQFSAVDDFGGGIQ